jgi:hypothetical protein
VHSGGDWVTPSNDGKLGNNLHGDATPQKPLAHITTAPLDIPTGRHRLQRLRRNDELESRRPTTGTNQLTGNPTPSQAEDHGLPVEERARRPLQQARWFCDRFTPSNDGQLGRNYSIHHAHRKRHHHQGSAGTSNAVTDSKPYDGDDELESRAHDGHEPSIQGNRHRHRQDRRASRRRTCSVPATARWS